MLITDPMKLINLDMQVNVHVCTYNMNVVHTACHNC